MPQWTYVNRFICMMKVHLAKESTKVEMAKQVFEQVANPLNKYDPLCVYVSHFTNKNI